MDHRRLAGVIKVRRLISVLVFTIGMLGVPQSASTEARHPMTSVARIQASEWTFIFEAAYQALLIGEPLAAVRLFDEVANSFPTPEALGNAGLARAMHAVSLDTKSGTRFVYPWMLDTSPRLEAAEAEYASVPVPRGKGDGQWLAEANNRLARAYLQDPSYLPAWINVVSLEGLRGRRGSANDAASNAMLIALKREDVRAQAITLTARGIASASCGRCETASEDLLKAKKLGYELAIFNLTMLDCSPPSTEDVSKSDVRPNEFSEERIGRFTAREARSSFTGAITWRNFRAISNRGEAPLPGVELGWTKDLDAQMMTMRISSTNGGKNTPSYVLLRTVMGYRGQTGKGLKVGDDVTSIRQAYGVPNKVMDTLDGQFLIYEVPRLVFELKNNQMVSWILYEPISHTTNPF